MVSRRGGSYAVLKLTTISFDLTIAQRRVSYVYQIYLV